MAIVNIVMPISRPDFLKRIFAQLDLMPCDREQVNIVTLVDGDLKLFELARNLTVGSKFNQKLCVFRSKGIPSVGNVRGRRKRISDIHNELKTYVKTCDFIFSLEDDTLIPLNTLERLLNCYGDYPHAGFISGLEVGRWGFSSIGAYHVNDVYEPTKFNSLPYPETKAPGTSDLERVDAAGLYGCLIKKDNYIKHDFKPFEDALGPDVDFGLSLRRVGFFNYVDKSLRFRHLTKTGDLLVDSNTVINFQLSKEEGKWRSQII